MIEDIVEMFNFSMLLATHTKHVQSFSKANVLLRKLKRRMRIICSIYHARFAVAISDVETRSVLRSDFRCSQPQDCEARHPDFVSPLDQQISIAAKRCRSSLQTERSSQTPSCAPEGAR